MLKFIILLAISCFIHAHASLPLNWYDDFIFKNNSFTFEMIRTLGYAYSQGADLGEAISTARSIQDDDINSWYTEWLQTADRLHAVGRKMEKTGNMISAREAYFRASNYYRAAGLYMVSKEDRPKSIAAYTSSKAAFLRAIKSSPDIKPILIPYENTTLPGYFIPSALSNAPLLIVHSGFDGTAEELYFEAGAAAHARGYNVLLFEGPGQGEVVRKQHLYFLYNWEKVVSPVVDFALTLPDVDKNRIALMGISMGGYLAARACAYEPRINACILNGGVYSVAANIYKNFPPNLIQWLEDDPAKFNEALYEEMKTSVVTAWFFNNAMWTFNASTPAEVMETLKPYTLQGVADKIKCPTLVIDSEDDQFYKGQPQEVYKALKSKKNLLRFTRKEDAQAHCQMGAIAISNEEVFAWLNKTFNFFKYDTKKRYDKILDRYETSHRNR